MGILLVPNGQLISAIVANLIAGLIFSWVDQFIFTSKSLLAEWEVSDNTTCVDCGNIARGYCLVRSGITTGRRNLNRSSGARRVHS